MYRNVIGFPGGMGNSTLLKLIELANVHAMPLVLGAGGPSSDLEGEYVVYVYDSRRHPFFRGEAHHQFHTNDVIDRFVPASYTHTLKEVQRGLGRLEGHGCFDPPLSFVSYLMAAVMGVPLGLTLGVLVQQNEQRQAWRKAQQQVPGGRVAAMEMGEDRRGGV